MEQCVDKMCMHLAFILPAHRAVLKISGKESEASILENRLTSARNMPIPLLKMFM